MNIAATPALPPDFVAAQQRVHELLDHSLNHDWTTTVGNTDIPLGVPCLVLCGQSATEEATSICLAFAAKVRRRTRWYGVTATYHEPAELWGVVGYEVVS